MTSSHTAVVRWSRRNQVFTDGRYSRAHEWLFDGGAVVPASSSPHVVRVPFSDPANVDPEEALVASVSSCHMLWFLSLAVAQGYVVDAYDDDAEGFMGDMGGGKTGVARIVLRPKVQFSGERVPDVQAVDTIHHDAHEQCFIASSLRSHIEVAGTWSHRTAQPP
jgi:organic hydroperoxide reductase OsmC/OhrA